MTRYRSALAALLTLIVSSSLVLPASAAESQTNWAQWRGPLATGEAPHSAPPIRWSEEENIRWKVELPGYGHASPIVWDDQVFLATAVPVNEKESDTGERSIQPSGPLQFTIFSLDRASGKTLWSRVAREATPHEGTHSHATWASASPVTDGEVLIVSFGSNGIYAYTLDGKSLWKVDLGDMTTRRGFGEGASPAIHGDTVIIPWDHEGDSFVVALSKTTGKEKWRQARDEPTSWATPLIVEHGERTQVILSGTQRTRAYDLANGEELWATGGMTTNTIPSPVYSDGTVFVMSGFRGNALQAIRLAHAKGEFSGGDAVSWTYDRDTPYVPSPLLYDETLYMLKHNTAILTAFDAKSGEVYYGPERIEAIDGAYGSPVGANGYVYLAGRDGNTVVLKAGSKFEVVATNILDEGFDASPAIVGNELLLRGRKSLYCIAKPATKKSETR